MHLIEITRRLMLRAIACAVVCGLTALGQSSGYSYMTNYRSSDGTRLYATTVTSGQMPGAMGSTHIYTAYTHITGPSGTQDIGCGTASTGEVPAQNYNSVQDSCYIDTFYAGTYSITSRGTAYCTNVMRTYYDTGNQQTPVVVPQVALSVETDMATEMGSRVLLGADKNTTAYTAVGVPSGGAYQWSLGPHLAFFSGSPAQGAATVYGTSPSTTTMDSSVKVTYTASGQAATASKIVTVDNPTRIAASLPGHIFTVPGGYYLSILYTAYDQFGEALAVPGVNITETLTTVSSTPSKINFVPGDNTPTPRPTDYNGTGLDSLYVTLPGGLPSTFAATRRQVFALSGYSLVPVNTQIYSQTSAYTTNSIFSR